MHTRTDDEYSLDPLNSSMYSMCIQLLVCVLALHAETATV